MTKPPSGNPEGGFAKQNGGFGNCRSPHSSLAYFIRRILTEFSRHSMETPVSANTATHILA